MMVERNKKVFKWQLRVDRSSNTHGSGAGVVVSTPEGDSVEYALRFDFKATNNQAEYEALIAGLKVCTVLGADKVEIFSDSQVLQPFYCLPLARSLTFFSRILGIRTPISNPFSDYEP
ncbi:hypothetical protein LWI29_037424 [Acer saccharum]|uniref:RNase H type-1 domain-containing protein n=1 Tax=Acer saccharum TaxID=4024 RepID=A0AA39VLA9_ACESA|nr:hypothetical protein LWI29_037424 [Acer saccharum]